MPASELRPPRGPFPGLPIIAITHVLAPPFGMNIFNNPGARHQDYRRPRLDVRQRHCHRPSRPRRAPERPSPVAGFDRTRARIVCLINE